MSQSDLYALFLLSFVQLFIATALIMTPLREIGVMFRWAGSRPIEVALSGLATIPILAIACVLAKALWGLPLGSLEDAACLVLAFTLLVIALRPDCNFMGQVFYASFAAAGLSFIASPRSLPPWRRTPSLKR